MDWNAIAAIAAVIAAIAAVYGAWRQYPIVPINHTKVLRELLKDRNWREADQETTRIMLKLAHREEEDWLDSKSFRRIPCKDLRIIDKLWVKYSEGHFGFSVQKRIWEDIGGNPEADYTIRCKFGYLVGWRETQEKAGEWKRYSELTFKLKDPKEAPKGYLPRGVREGYNEPFIHFGERKLIFTRLKNCKIR